MRIETIDLLFQGTPHVIASFLLRGPTGNVLIETGPSTTQAALHEGLATHGLTPSDIGDVLLTHIHLDHAGAAGWWAAQGARIWVHANGAPHVVDPSKLVASATRIYGDRMQTLWGEIPPAPADRVHVVSDGDVLQVGGLKITAIEAPGHARHHHVYLVDGVAFAGDAAGIMLPGREWIDLPAPPPEFDLDAWRATLGRLREQSPSMIYRTHFDGSSDVAAELDRFEICLEQGASWIRQMLEVGLDREAMITAFGDRMRDAAADAGVPEADARAYELANPRVMSVDGIARYWKQQGLGGRL